MKWKIALVVLAATLAFGAWDYRRNNTPSDAPCLTTGDAFEDVMRIGEASAVRSNDRLGNGQPTWYVSTVSGATWAVSSNPTSLDYDNSLVVPLNDRAKSESDLGSAIGDNAPAFGDTSESRPDARRSRECASPQ